MGHDHEECWQCGHPEAGSLFCRYCNTLQPPRPDYFSFFGIGRRLALDTADLQKKFYALSRLLHPDRYTRSSERERNYSLAATAILNDGYRILRDPVARAELVLKEAGVEMNEERAKDVPPELLEEVFELNMALDELRTGDDSVLPQLRAAREHFTGLRGEIDREMEQEFTVHDEAGAEGREAVLARLRGLLNRRRYVRNLIQEVDKELAAR